ncbi:unnamed protein product [Caenorhabditis angaria]|uniref:RING-type domain-containing protein n=1 Tax=Caenorhabditis angaria TaxID=860376 RepID=A0A9P1I4B3_9PELO|nr:unnamed protein product [Caenorhabditis angaria]
MESRLFEELLQHHAATSIVPPATLLQTQLENLAAAAQTSSLPTVDSRTLYTTPPNVPLTISTNSIANNNPATPVNNNARQIYLDAPLCYNQTHSHHHHHHLLQRQQFQQDAAHLAARRAQYQQHRARLSNNAAFNQLKDTVVRVQQRKRQREANLSNPAEEEQNTASSSSSSLPSSSSAAKIRRRESAEASEAGASSSTTSTSTSTDRRCGGNQQITGPVRQHESRNCHYCNSTPQQQVIQTRQPMYTANDIALAASAAAAAATAAAAAVNSYIRPAQPTHVLYPLNNHVRLLQEAIMTNHVNQQYQYAPLSYSSVPLQNAGVYVLQPHLRDLTYMFNFISADVLRDRGTIDRHHMFTTADDVPVGASTQDIEKHTKKVVFEKDEEEKPDETDRCTVCLCDFEGGKEVRKLQCDHIFHPDCIDKWLFYNKKCPVCRMEVDKKLTPAATSSVEIPL